MGSRKFGFTIIIFLIIGLMLPNFCFAQQPTSWPKKPEETKEAGERVLQAAQKELSGIIQRVWQEKILPVWQKTWNWFKENIWFRIEGLINSEIEKRKKYFKEGLEREKEEIKEEIKTEAAKTSQSLWERFKALIK